MTTHRAVLPIAEAKCTASHLKCKRSDHCARHSVSYVPGRPVRDYSSEVNAWDADACAGFLSIDYRGAVPAKPVHAAPKGIC